MYIISFVMRGADTRWRQVCSRAIIQSPQPILSLWSQDSTSKAPGTNRNMSLACPLCTGMGPGVGLGLSQPSTHFLCSINLN